MTNSLHCYICGKDSDSASEFLNHINDLHEDYFDGDGPLIQCPCHRKDNSDVIYHTTKARINLDW